MIVGFGARLSKQRDMLGLSQGKLAKRIGKSPSMIAMYESSSRMPSPETLVRLSQVLGVTTDYLLGIDEDSDKKLLNMEGLTHQQIRAVYAIVDEYRKANGCE